MQASKRTGLCCCCLFGSFLCSSRWLSSFDPGREDNKRLSRRRLAAVSLNGRFDAARKLIDTLKTKSENELRPFLDKLHPQVKLDAMRMLYQKRRGLRAASTIPRYRSSLFGRRYFFKEEDVDESSTLGRGPGGQATNRRMQTVCLKHRPSGLIVKFSRFPSLRLNRRAARELLNLRLEESLLGDNSELGRLKKQRERRRQWREKKIGQLLVRANNLAARDTHQRHYLAFLKDVEPLPPQAMAQIILEGEPLRKGWRLFISDLFNSECRAWWPMLQTAFARANTAHRKNVCIADEHDKAAPVSLPLILEYLFPIAVEARGESERDYEVQQLEQCRKDAVARSNVQRALRCYCELFGLRLTQTVRASGVESSILAKDGINWIEFQGRMIAKSSGHSTAFACAAWARVYRCLKVMNLDAEAKAVRVFFSKEVRREGSGWAKEILEAITVVAC